MKYFVYALTAFFTCFITSLIAAPVVLYSGGPSLDLTYVAANSSLKVSFTGGKYLDDMYLTFGNDTYRSKYNDTAYFYATIPPVVYP